MVEKSRSLTTNYESPKSWAVVMFSIFGGALAAMIGSGALVPHGYRTLGIVIFWLGTVVMVVAAALVLSVFLRLLRPPGIRDTEW